MKEKMTNEFVQAMLIRAGKTAAQAILSLITVGAAIDSFDWKVIISIAATSFVYSCLTSIAFGLPETNYQGELSFSQDDEDEGVVKPVIKFDISGDEILDRDSVNIKINNKEN